MFWSLNREEKGRESKKWEWIVVVLYPWWCLGLVGLDCVVLLGEKLGGMFLGTAL